MPRYSVDTSPYDAVFDDSNPLIGGASNLSASIINATSRSLDRKQAGDQALLAHQQQQQNFLDSLGEKRDATDKHVGAEKAAIKQRADAHDSEEMRKWVEDFGNGIRHTGELLGFGKGASTPARTTPLPMNDGELTRAALEAAKYEAGVDDLGKQKPVTPERFRAWKKELAKRGNEPSDPALDGALVDPHTDPTQPVDQAPLSSPGHPAFESAGPTAASGADPATMHALLQAMTGNRYDLTPSHPVGEPPAAPDPSIAAPVTAAPAPATGAPQRIVRQATLQALVKAGKFPSLEAAAADAQANGRTVAP